MQHAFIDIANGYHIYIFPPKRIVEVTLTPQPNAYKTQAYIGCRCGEYMASGQNGKTGCCEPGIFHKCSSVHSLFLMWKLSGSKIANLNGMKSLDRKITQSYAILKFYKQLSPELDLGEGVAVMNPFTGGYSWQLTETFYNKFYSDTHPRKFIFGINPGRFGGGVTGIPFTDPIRLKEICGIDNDLPKKAELSSQFIYDMINAYGGPEAFYYDFYITALSPLGFTKNGINLNYYDDKALLKSIEPFIVHCIQQQQQTIAGADACFCLGEGTNFKIFQKLNQKYGFFKAIIPLPHPRFIMQYRRKKVDEYVRLYIDKLKAH